MAAKPADDTRRDILRVALEAFSHHGYHATSVRTIAERVGLTKTAVLYHFPEKADLLAALAEPLVASLLTAVDAAKLVPPEQARWKAIEGLLEAWLTHRHLLRMSLQDLALQSVDTVLRQFRDTMIVAHGIVAGPHPRFRDRVRAAQALAMLGDPVVLFADAPIDLLRREVLDGVRHFLDGGARAAPTPARRRRGRPSEVSAQMAERARQLYAQGARATAIARTLGVSRATVYRHLDL